MNISALLLAVSLLQSNSVMVSWDAPTLNEDGTPIDTLLNYKVYYGKQPQSYDNIAWVSGNVTSHRIFNLSSGMWHFAVSATNSFGEGRLSEEVSIYLPPQTVAKPQRPVIELTDTPTDTLTFTVADTVFLGTMSLKVTITKFMILNADSVRYANWDSLAFHLKDEGTGDWYSDAGKARNGDGQISLHLPNRSGVYAMCATVWANGVESPCSAYLSNAGTGNRQILRVEGMIEHVEVINLNLKLRIKL